MPSEPPSSVTYSPMSRQGLFVCLVIAVVLRGIVLCLYADELTHDRDAYLAIAGGVAQGRGFVDPDRGTPTAFRPPLYILQIAALSKLIPVAYAVAAFNVFWGLVTVWATWRAGYWLGLGAASTLAAMLVAMDPMLLQYSAQPMTEVTCAGLVASLIYWFVRRDVRQSWRDVGIGVLFGLLVLCRPTFWPLAGLAAVCWGIERWRNRRNAVPQSLSLFIPWRIVVGLLLVVAPWVIRNQIVMGSPILATTHGGYTLLLANNPVFYTDVVQQPWGAEWPKASFDRWQSELQTRLTDDLGADASEQARDQWQNRTARRFIADDRAGFLHAMWYRVRSLWRTTPQRDAGAAIESRVVQLVGWYYTAVLLVFVAGLFRWGGEALRFRGFGRSISWLSLLLILLTVQSVHLVYWTNARMRAPIVPVISLFAAAAVKRPVDSA